MRFAAREVAIDTSGITNGAIRVIELPSCRMVSSSGQPLDEFDPWDDEISHAHDDRDRWNHLIELEIEASAEPGCLDMGTHIIAVGRKHAQ